MSRDRFTQAAAVLQKIIEQPKRAPSRIFASEGINYNFLNKLLSSGLVEFLQEKRNRRRLVLTENGRAFLRAYRICERLFFGYPGHEKYGESLKKISTRSIN